MAEALIGTTLEGGYRIESLLGTGGMGSVYKATHVRLGKSVAVKIMATELVASSESLARFHREALVTGSLGHPHIVQVFDFSTTPNGQPFLVMEFLEGEDLDHRLARVGRLPRDQLSSLVKQVSSALEATHAKGIVHRDLKPANIYLLEAAGESNFVKVLDFGISKMRAATRQLTRTASIMGTPNYMSPEQALGKIDQIDERTDQWSLACIVWECLAGVRTFDAEEGTAILYQVVHEPPPPLLPKVPGLNPRVEAVLLQALSKAKQDRFSCVGEFSSALESALSAATAPVSLSLTAKLPSSEAPSSPRPTTLSRTNGELTGPGSTPVGGHRRWARIATVALTSGLLLGTVFLLRTRWAVKPQPMPPGATSMNPRPSSAPPPIPQVSPSTSPIAPDPSSSSSPAVQIPPATPEPPESPPPSRTTAVEDAGKRGSHGATSTPEWRATVRKDRTNEAKKAQPVQTDRPASRPKRTAPKRQDEEEQDKWRLD